MLLARRSGSDLTVLALREAGIRCEADRTGRSLKASLSRQIRWAGLLREL